MSECYSNVQQLHSYKAVTLGALLKPDAVDLQLSTATHSLGDGHMLRMLWPYVEVTGSAVPGRPPFAAGDAATASEALKGGLRHFHNQPDVPGPFDPVAVAYLGGAGSVLEQLRVRTGLSLAPIAVPADGNCLLHAVSIAMTS